MSESFDDADAMRPRSQNGRKARSAREIVKEMGAVHGNHSECVHFYRFQLMLSCRDYGASLNAVRMKVHKGRRSRKSKAPDPLFGPGANLRNVAKWFWCYLTTDWKSGEVRRLANWLSEEE
jgi:hypothetical protein